MPASPALASRLRANPLHQPPPPTTVALAYHKCWDDWHDDRNVAARTGAGGVGEAVPSQVRERLPQAAAIEDELAAIARLEQANAPAPDEAARCFGHLMGELFVVEQDPWSETLRSMGRHLGRFVYLMDAACDLEHDQKHGSYNPLSTLDVVPADLEAALSAIMGEATAAFEKLPLEQDLHLLRNVLDGGVWSRQRPTQEEGRGGT